MEVLDEDVPIIPPIDEEVITEMLSTRVDQLTKETDRYKGLAVISILSGGILSQLFGSYYPSVEWLTEESVTLSATVIHHLDPEIETVCRRYAMIQERKRIKAMNEPQPLDTRDREEMKSGAGKLVLTIGFHALNKGISKFMGEDSSILNLSKMAQKLLSGESKNFLGIIQKLQTAFG